MPTYDRTHPWLTFSLDLSRAPWQLWLLAGEAISKCEHLAGVALTPDAANELMKVYLAKGALATTAIEGNTLTEAQARQRVEGIKSLPPSKAYLGIEIDNIIEASNEILSGCLDGTVPPLTPALIRQFNERVLKGLTLGAEIHPGELRTYSVGVADYRGAPAGDLEYLLGRLCGWLAQPWITELPDYSGSDQLRLDAVLKAIVAHLYLAWIHPFGDGNGRTARLVEFYLLATGGVPFPAAHLLSNHYNQTRSEYYRQLSAASKSGGDVIPFILYALRGLVDELRAQIEVIRDQQLDLFWKHHVHQVVGDSETGRRRRYLVEDLSAIPAGVTRSKLADVSVRVLRHYMGRGEKTLQRDVSELERLDLIRREGDRYIANKGLVLAYMPPKRLLGQAQNPKAD
jgi:Fic family protein